MGDENVETTQEQKPGRGPKAGERPLPTLDLNPTHPHDWNGAPQLFLSCSAKEDAAVERIFERMGSLRLLKHGDTNYGRQDVATNVDIAKGLIRRLLGAQIYFMGKDYFNKSKQVTGYTTGLKLLDPKEKTFNEGFFSKLFSGIMAETQLHVPYYGYVISFCNNVLKSANNSLSGAMSGVVPEPDLTVSLFLLSDVLKNICEESENQFDLSTSSAFGWLNIWLLGVQKNLVCKEIPSERHLKQFRNSVAHNQFKLNLNYMQLFNNRRKKHTTNQRTLDDDDDSASGNDETINWMSQIVLEDLFDVNKVLQMLHNAGYIINVSRDEENMKLRRDTEKKNLQAIQELQRRFPGHNLNTLRSVCMQMEGDVEKATNFLLSGGKS